MIKAVIFDVGGVLLRTEDFSPRRALEKRYGMSPGESEDLVFNSKTGIQAQMGEISRADLWSWIRKTLGLDEHELVAFADSFWGGDEMDYDLIAFIRSLRPHYQTAIISNADEGLRAILAEDYQISDAFDLIVMSAEEKVMKPDHEIYRRTLHRLGRRPEESIFIDDNLDNIESALRLGMKAIHYRPGLNLPAILEEML